MLERDATLQEGNTRKREARSCKESGTVSEIVRQKKHTQREVARVAVSKSEGD